MMKGGDLMASLCSFATMCCWVGCAEPSATPRASIHDGAGSSVPSEVDAVASAERVTKVIEPYFGQRGPRPEPDHDPNDTVFWNRWRDESVDPASFIELTEPSDVAEAKYASGLFLEGKFKAEAHLYRGTGRRHFLHVKPDIILHRYDHEGLRLLVYENPAFITTRVATAREKDETPEAFVDRVTRHLYKKPRTWHFFPTTAHDESVRFSTFDDYRADMVEDQIGTAGAIVEGGLYFTFYRFDNSYQMIGTRPLLTKELYALWERHHPATKRGAP